MRKHFKRFVSASTIALMLSTAAFPGVSLAAEHHRHHHRPFVGRVISVDTDANVLIVTLPPRRHRPAVEATVNYSPETTFLKDKQEADESALTIGAVIRFDGEISVDHLTKTVSIDDVTKIGL